MVIPVLKFQDLPCLAHGWSFGSSQLEDEDRQEDLGIHSLV